jgi:phosphoglycerol transferase MdoB-like AlkP superfamily enzyme
VPASELATIEGVLLIKKGRSCPKLTSAILALLILVLAKGLFSLTLTDLTSKGGKLLTLSVYLLILSFLERSCLGCCAMVGASKKNDTIVPNNLVITNVLIFNNKYWEQE